MTPSFNGYIETSERDRPNRDREEPPFAIQLGVLMLCLFVLAVLTVPIWW
jgi:hypothetical protein